MNYSLIKPRDENLSALEQVLFNRGINIELFDKFLHTTDDVIYDPKTIDRIQDGVKMLLSHIVAEHDILIQVDSDCDGMTSAAVLINYLHRYFPNFVKSHITYRFHEGKQHGIIFESVGDNIKLVIAPDASSNDYEIHQKLAEKGIDVLVIDHHEADKISEYACVINNQLCDYPTKSLSGVGMVYKFCCYLDNFLGKPCADDYLDLVALGMIADVMSLRDLETKRLVEKGLTNLRNPFFKMMVDKNAFSLKGELTPEGVAWYIGPSVNAVLRFGEEPDKRILFKAMLDFEAYKQIPSTKRGCKGQLETVVEQAVRNCTNLKNRQNDVRDEVQANLERLVEEQNLLQHKILVIKCEDSFNRNLTGLIANQLAAKFQRPTLLLNKVDNEWHGSGRSFNFEDFRDFCLASELTLYAQGHQGAFGIAFKDDATINLFLDYCDSVLSNIEFKKEYKVDLIYDYGNFNGKDILDIAALRKVWGKDVEEPWIVIENIKLNRDNFSLLSPDNKPTLKINLPNGVSLIKFKSSEDEYESLYSENGCYVINVVGKCNINEWCGRVTPQLIIEEYEVIEKQNYYF